MFRYTAGKLIHRKDSASFQASLSTVSSSSSISNFGATLQSSRLTAATLISDKNNNNGNKSHRNLIKNSLQSSADIRVPTHQVIYSTSSLREIQEWGIKRPIPNKHISKHIVVKDIDNANHMVNYDSGSGSVLLVKRLKELLKPLQPLRPTEDSEPKYRDGQSSLFKGHSPQLKLFRSAFPILKRKEFLRWLYIQSGQQLNEFTTAKDLQLKVDEFLDYKAADSEKIHYRNIYKHYDVTTPIASAGLLYSLPGGLFSSPNEGISKSRTIKGRFLDKTGRVVAAGGVIASADLGNFSVSSLRGQNANIRQQQHIFSVRSLTVNQKAHVGMVVKSHSNSSPSRPSASLMKPKHDKTWQNLIYQSLA